MSHDGFARVSLPCQPQVLLRVLELKSSGVEQIPQGIDLVGEDPALCAAVFAAARGSVEPRHSGCVTIEDALSSVGIGVVQSIAVRSAGYLLSDRGEAQQITRVTGFWRRSIYVAALARALAILAGYREPEEAYLAGLLHNIGQFMLFARSPQQYNDILEAASSSHRLRQLERSHFNSDHHEAGSGLIASWDLATFLQDAIRYHGEQASALGAAHPLVKIVHLATTLSPDDDEATQAGMTRAGAWFQLSAHEVGEQVTVASHRVEALERDLGITANSVNQKQPQRALAERIRNVALLDEASQSLRNARSRDGAIDAVLRGARLMMDVPVARLLLYDQESGYLRGAAGHGGDALWEQLDIPATTEGGIAARVLSEFGSVSSFDGIEAELKVIDRQMLGLLKQPGMVCVCLGRPDRVSGVLVLGLDEVQVSVVRERMALLQRFAERADDVLPGTQSCGMPASPDYSYLPSKVRQFVHEARNPLTALRNYIQVLVVKYPDADWTQEDLPVLGKEIDRAEAILSRLSGLASSESSSEASVRVDVNKIIEDLLRIQRRSLLEPKGIEVKLDLDNEVPPLTLNGDAFKQVFTNLVSNAGEAMPEGGALAVITRDAVLDDQGAYVEVCIEDSGPGLPDKVMNQMYRPIVSDRENEHRGLGLSIVKELMDDMGGRVQCYSERDQGTRFRLLLPRNIGDI